MSVLIFLTVVYNSSEDCVKHEAQLNHISLSIKTIFLGLLNESQQDNSLSRVPFRFVSSFSRNHCCWRSLMVLDGRNSLEIWWYFSNFHATLPFNFFTSFEEITVLLRLPTSCVLCWKRLTCKWYLRNIFLGAGGGSHNSRIFCWNFREIFHLKLLRWNISSA